ncbi:hypothetical protein [Streptomyces sp. NPDC087270]|uniref:hypothetical protein n=1 Tax=Streptomyces sp. NPDC087270 TaxID=3365774 RepID=UPI003812FDDE
MRVNKRITGVLAACCLGGAAVLVSAGSAQAATNCTLGGGGHPDWHTCHNVVGATVYGGQGPSSKTDGTVNLNVVSGHLNSNPSWFECRIDNGPWNGGGPHPNRWLYTESDDGGWGWVADTDISDETNPVLGCGEFA